MERFDLSDGFNGRRYDGRYPHHQYLTPHEADEYRAPLRKRPVDASIDKERRRHSTGRAYRPDHHLRHQIGDEGQHRRARSSRRSFSPGFEDQFRSNDDRRAGRGAVDEDVHEVEEDEDYDSDDWDCFKSEQGASKSPAFQENELQGSAAVVYGEHRYQNNSSRARQQSSQLQDSIITGRQHLTVDDPKLAQEPSLRENSGYSSHMAYGEHVLATKSDSYGTLDRRIDDIALQTVHHTHVPNPRPRKSKKPKKEKNIEHRVDDESLPEHSAAFLVPQRHEQVSRRPKSTSRSMEISDHHLHYAHAGQNGHMHDRPSSTPPQEGEKLTHRSSIPLRPYSQARARSYNVGVPSNTGPRFDTTELFPEAQLPHFSVSQFPSDLSQSMAFSVAPGDSRSESENTKGRSRLGSGSLTTSTSFLSLPNSPSGSSILGPKSYHYLPLGDMEFRLIRILPERMSKLKCEIVHQSLKDPPDYVAISYAWGDGVDTKPLVLQGATIPVAASLYDALKAIRQKKVEALVWVDALCIDQQNKDERATQVRLMGHIYSRAMSVAIWLGPEADDSTLAVQLLEKVAHNAVSPQRIRSLRKYPDSAALFELFKRDYWKRLWVVQEVLLAEKKMVYCGHSILPWELYRQAADAFWDRDSDPHIRQGPSSFPQMSEIMQLGDESLLEVMRACRKKLSENPRDKVFGILGLLPDATQREFPVDYSQSVKTVYTDVVDYLISTTDQIDVIRESIHFPIHVNTTGLPSWCPDWSHIPEVSGLSRTLGFDASYSREGPTKAQYRFYDERRKLEISAIRLDAIRATGIAVGTFCASQDYLTAFLHWRAILLHKLNIEEGNESHPLHKAFCRTLCLGQVPAEQSQPQLWHDLCYHVFSSLIREKLPRLPMDEDLEHHANATGLIDQDARRKFLQDNFGNRMMGRSFCVTEQGLIGMGSGYMTAGDLVVVPFGCSTPILLRPKGRRDEYRYVGDVYIEGYMHGEAVQQLEAGDGVRVVSKYMLC